MLKSVRNSIDAIMPRGQPAATSSSRLGNAAVIGRPQINIKDSAPDFRADLTVVGTSVKDNAAARRPRHFVYAAVYRSFIVPSPQPADAAENPVSHWPG